MTAFTTDKGRPQKPPAAASSSACSGICEPIVAAVYCSARSAPMQTTMGSGAPTRFARSIGEPKVAAVIELDGSPVRPDELQPMIGRVVNSGLGIADDDDAGGDEAAGILGGMKKHRQHAREIDRAGMNVLLGRAVLDHDRRQRRSQRTADRIADAAKIDAERSLAIGLAAQQVADDRNVVAINRGEHQRRAAVALFEHTRHCKLGIDRRRIGLQAAVGRHAVKRGTKACIQNFGIREHSICRYFAGAALPGSLTASYLANSTLYNSPFTRSTRRI